MDPLILALARLGAMLGMNLIEMLKAQGATFTDDQLRTYRAESQRVVDEWNAMDEEEEE